MGVVSDNWVVGLPDVYTISPEAIGCQNDATLFVCKQENQIILVGLKPDGVTAEILYRDGGHKDDTASIAAINEHTIRIIFSSATNSETGSSARIRAVVYALPIEYKVFLPIIKG